MAARTKATPAGIILDPARFAQVATLTRPSCDPALTPWVEHYWTVSWELPDGVSYRSSTVPAPSCNLTVEYGGCARAGARGSGVFVTGVVSRQRFDVFLHGSGGVVGVKFRPGGLTALSGVDAAGLRDRVVAANHVLPGADELAGLRADDPDMTGRLDAYLAALPTHPDNGDYRKLLSVLDILDNAEPAITAADLAERCGLGLRTLQRVCRRYLGVGPQWLIARARVHAAIARMHGDAESTLARLATDCGWFDQAHMGRDFVALVGEPPGRYRERQRTGVR